MTIDERLLRLLGAHDLAQLRQRLRRRFESVDAEPSSIRLDKLVPHERTALAALTGAATRVTSSIKLDVLAIDASLSEAGLATSLRHALEQLDGPMVNRQAVRDEERARWEATVKAVGLESLAVWLAPPLNLGLVKRFAGGQAEAAAQILARVELVLRRLPAQGLTRSELAAAVLGDAHALDNGRPEASIVLNVLKHARRDTEAEQDPEEERRETWATAGVLVNELARPALFLNLPVVPGHAQLAPPGEPSFVSLRKLLRNFLAWNVTDRDVFVCENPNIVAIAADRLGSVCAPLVCTDGMPAAAQRTLLTQLAAAGARLWYHGDFDWPGIRIANLVVREHAARPWRMSTEDYAVSTTMVATRVPLVGSDVEASWDAALSARMTLLDVSVAEEAVVSGLLVDLGRKESLASE